MEEYFEQDPDFKWTQAPRPRLTDRSYKHNYYDEKISLEAVSYTHLDVYKRQGAMSQGYIGYQLSQAILNELKRRDIMRSTACIVTCLLYTSRCV